MPKTIVAGYEVSTSLALLDTAVYPVGIAEPGHCVNCHRQWGSQEEAVKGHELLVAAIKSGELKPAFTPLDNKKELPKIRAA